ncbi:hypothetical protein NU271_04755, partial [Limosilactobacillus reuteri]
TDHTRSRMGTIKNGQLAILGPTDSFYLTAIDDVEFVGVVDIKKLKKSVTWHSFLYMLASPYLRHI